MAEGIAVLVTILGVVAFVSTDAMLMLFDGAVVKVAILGFK